MEGVIWGLLGALLIGGSDVVARVTAQKVSLSVLFLAVMGLSFVAMTVMLTVTGQWPHWHAYAWLISAISGLLNLVALYFLYQALARGPVSVASPAASSFVVILVGMNVFAGQPYSWLQVVAAVTVFFGVAMLAQRDNAIDDAADFSAEWLRRTALFGIAAAAAISLRMFLAQEASDELGAVASLYLNRLFALLGVILILIWVSFRAGQLSWPQGSRMRWLVALQSLLETLALTAFLFGSAGTGRIGAAIGFAAFAAVSAIIARVWLGEPVGVRRSLWIAVVAGGVALAAAGGP
ncbi:MAG: EamA family transporter [Burkholderiaceae bacterium]